MLVSYAVGLAIYATVALEFPGPGCAESIAFIELIELQTTYLLLSVWVIVVYLLISIMLSFFIYICFGSGT